MRSCFAPCRNPGCYGLATCFGRMAPQEPWCRGKCRQRLAETADRRVISRFRPPVQVEGGVSGLDDALGLASPPSVRKGQIRPRAHLDEPRCGAGKLLRLEAIARTVEPFGLRLGRCHELDGPVVERVDEDDEALGF